MDLLGGGKTVKPSRLASRVISFKEVFTKMNIPTAKSNSFSAPFGRPAGFVLEHIVHYIAFWYEIKG